MKPKTRFLLIPPALLLIACTVCLFPMPKAAEALPRDQYEINASTDLKRLTGKETVKTYNRTNKTFDAIRFYLYGNLYEDASRVAVREKTDRAYPNGFSPGKTEVLRVAVEGEETAFTLSEDRTVLTVPVTSLRPGAFVTLELDFTTVLPDSPARFGKGESTSNFGSWYPVLCAGDDPISSPFGDPCYSDCADYTVTIRAPKECRLASSGVIESKETDVFHSVWKVKGENLRDFAFVLSESFSLCSRHAGDTLVYVYGFGEGAETALDVACRALSCFSAFFGAYPYGTFTLAACDLYYAGMEYPGIVMIDKKLFDSDMSESLEETIVHETAHQWWYALVGSDAVRDAWLDEGLAQYSAALYMEEVYGRERYASFIRSSETYVRAVFDSLERFYGKVSRAVHRPTSDFEHFLLYNAMCYDAPCVMFDALRTLIGKDALLDGLKRYASENAFKKAGKEDLFRALTASSGKDVGNYLSAWLAGSVYWE